jgi:alpha-tubulin suppressor-like RCC1 family protein
VEGGAHHSVLDRRVYACGRADAGQIGTPKDHGALVSRGEDRDHVQKPVRVKFDGAWTPAVLVRTRDFEVDQLKQSRFVKASQKQSKDSESHQP